MAMITMFFFLFIILGKFCKKKAKQLALVYAL